MINCEDIGDYDKIYNYLENDHILGYLEFRIIDGILDIINIFVNEENRRQGIATKLLSKMIEEENYRRIILEVNKKNIETIKIYKKLLFSEISIIERYYGTYTAISIENVK